MSILLISFHVTCKTVKEMGTFVYSAFHEKEQRNVSYVDTYPLSTECLVIKADTTLGTVAIDLD